MRVSARVSAIVNESEWVSERESESEGESERVSERVSESEGVSERVNEGVNGCKESSPSFKLTVHENKYFI